MISASLWEMKRMLLPSAARLRMICMSSSKMCIRDSVWLGNEALNIGTENIHFATLPGDGSGYYNKQSVYVLDAQATCDLVNEALNPYNAVSYTHLR